MSPETTRFNLQTVSSAPSETRRLGRKIGRLLRRGTILALSGDLGSGKTAFVQGLAAGLDVPEDCYVTSPTYTLINEYPGRLPVFHVDLYRISDPLEFDDIGLLDILYAPDNIVAVEWAERLGKDLPCDHLAVEFSILGDRVRKIRLSAYGLDAAAVLKRIAI